MCSITNTKTTGDTEFLLESSNETAPLLARVPTPHSARMIECVSCFDETITSVHRGNNSYNHQNKGLDLQIDFCSSSHL